MQKVNTAICSFGMSGQVFHAPFISAHSGFELYGVWERSQKQAAAKYPGIISFDSLDEMLADENIDLVIVNTPVYTHFEFAEKALLAGKHVLVEKAFTVTAKEAKELTDLAKAKNKILCVFQNRRYDSDFKTVKKIVESGVLGKLNEAAFHYDRFNLQLSPKQHKEDGNPGAGLLHDLGPHLIDQSVYLFGMPETVSASVRITRPASIVNDYFDIMLSYSEMNLRLKAGFIVKEPGPSFILHGSEGSFLKLRADVQEDDLKAGRLPDDTGWGTEPASAGGLLVTERNGNVRRETIVSESGNYMQLFNELYEAIVHNGPVPVTGANGIAVMTIIGAAAESERKGQRIRI